MQLDALFSPNLCVINVNVRSAKKLFEVVSEMLSQQKPEFDKAKVFDALTARERLGSTGLGYGAAVPHCRLGGSNQASVGVMVQLKTPIGLDSPDQKPVDLLAFIIVNGEAHQTHLDALAAIAKKLSDDTTRNALRTAISSQELYQILIET